MFKLFSLLFLSINFAWGATSYPRQWWKPIPVDQRQGNWEILPQEAGPNEVILSKRNELGVFSNLAYAPFILDGILYYSIEGLWQGMKYPDFQYPDDQRTEINEYPFEREAVYLMHGFESKSAGDKANEINKKFGINWISYKGEKFDYKDDGPGSEFHYQLIYSATEEKIRQNPQIKELLFKTKGLILKPDHHQGSNVTPAYEYHKILMKIRDSLIY
jgi:predicted NAD-dependent protein-ADP-ribosyltransferase YbiA (DUF1768 family)